MITAWTKNIKDAEEKQRFQNHVLSSRAVLERLQEILKEIEIEDLDRSETDAKSYDSPNWAYKQAHKNGYRACLKTINRIITLDQKDTNDREFTRPHTARPGTPDRS